MRVLLLCVGAALCCASSVGQERPASKLDSKLKTLASTHPDRYVTLNVLLRRVELPLQANSGAATRADSPELVANRLESVPDVHSKLEQEVVHREGLLRSNSDKFQESQEKVIAWARSLGGTLIYRFALRNMITVRMRAKDIEELAKLDEVERIEEDMQGSFSLDVSVPTTGVTGSFWANGYTGSGVTIAVIDTGTDLNHPTFANAPKSALFFLSAAQQQTSCFADAMDSDDRAGHGTHVAGIALGRGSTACFGCQGMAKGATLLSLKAAYKSLCENQDFQLSDIAQAGENSASAKILNLSLGIPASNDDDFFAQAVDGQVADLGQIIVVAAGNLGPNVQTLASPGIAFNAITVASADDKGTVSRSDDVISDFSSRGPTLGFRKKPDITAPGGSITSAAFDWEQSLDYVAKPGTSMAAPHVAGAAAILVGAGITNPLSVKARLINTAQDRGTPGWDPEWGWGYLDMQMAFVNGVSFSGGVAPNGTEDSYRLLRADTAFAGFGKATLVWNRHVDAQFTCEGETQEINDLDLWAFDEATGSILDASVERYDNVEQVVVPGISSVVLKVKAFCGSFGQAAFEPFAIAVPPGTWIGSVAFLPSLVPITVAPNAQFEVQGSVTNVNNLKAHSLNVTLTLPVGYTLINGANPRLINGLTPGEKANLAWLVQAPSTESTQFAILGATSSSYGEIFSMTNSAMWTVAPPKPAVNFSAMSLDFAQVLFISQSVKNVTLTNGGSAILTISSLATSVGFLHSNNCPEQLAVGASCEISVVFNPGSIGAKQGTLSIVSNAPGSPHTVALSGTGIDIVLSLTRSKRPARNATTAASIQAFELNIAPSPGLEGMASLGCTSPSPEVRCSVSPAAVRSGRGPSKAVVTVGASPRSQRLRSRTTQNLILKVYATIQGVTKTVDLPVQVAR